MEKLPISIGILSWHSGQVLVDTLTTYYENGLFDIVNDVTILFQEFNEQDYQIAKHFGLNVIGMNSNIGIGKAFIKLTENAQADYILVLEHDWNLIEDKESPILIGSCDCGVSYSKKEYYDLINDPINKKKFIDILQETQQFYHTNSHGGLGVKSMSLCHG